MATNINKGVLQVLPPRPTSCTDAVEIKEHKIARETYSTDIVEDLLKEIHSQAGRFV